MIYPWHATLWGQLDELLDRGRIAHALLLVQPQGWGIEAVAQRFAGRLLGRDNPELDLDQFASPDFHLIRRQQERTQIVIAQIRALTEFVQRTATGERKVALLVEADRMNLPTANALLKTLEEPPPNNVLVLTSSRPERLLPTIRSRCQTLAEPPGDPALAGRWVGDTLGLDADEARLGLWLCGGAPLMLAAGITDDGPRPGEFVAGLQQLLSGDPAGNLLLAQGLPEVIVDWWANVVRLAMRHAARADVPVDLAIAADLGAAGSRRLYAFLDRLLNARGALAGPVNRGLLFDQLAWHFRQLRAAGGG